MIWIVSFAGKKVKKMTTTASYMYVRKEIEESRENLISLRDAVLAGSN